MENNLKEFLNQATDYLNMEYDNSYKFVTEFQERNNQVLYSSVGLIIIVDDHWIIKTFNWEYLKNIYNLWLSQSFIEESKQYTWQKELIDIIEGS